MLYGKCKAVPQFLKIGKILTNSEKNEIVGFRAILSNITENPSYLGRKIKMVISLS